MVILFLTGCGGNGGSGTRNLYYWGNYENTIYEMYLEPGNTSPTKAILQLEEQIEKTVAAGKFVPPGVHAHLGYLYADQGDYATALIHFQTEKEKYPESAHFIDGTIERMKK